MQSQNIQLDNYDEILSNILNLPDEFLFNICMGKTKLESEKLEKMFPELPYQNFYNMMKKYGNEKYNKMLYMYHPKWLSWYKNMQTYKATQDDFKENKSKYELEISKALRISLYLQEITSSAFEFSIANNKEQITIKNDRFKYAIHRAVLDEFRFLSLNYTKMTEEEAIESLKIQEERDWLLEHDELFGRNDIVLDENDNFSQFAIDTYRFARSKRREINSLFVNEVIKDLEDYIVGEKKLGAKTKNLEFGDLTLRLSYLFRIDAFLNQTKISDIDKFPFSNEGCRNISDYLDFLDLTIRMYPTARFGTPIDKNGNEIKDNTIYDPIWISNFTNRNTTNIRSMIDKAIKRRTPENLLAPFRRIFEDNPKERINRLWELKNRNKTNNEEMLDLSIFDIAEIFI